MSLPQNSIPRRDTSTSTHLLVAARRAEGLGVAGLFCCALSGIAGVIALTIYLPGFLGDRTRLMLVLGWTLFGLGLATYFCWASLQFGREMRAGIATGSAHRYQKGFEWLARMLWGVIGAIAFIASWLMLGEAFD